MLVLIIVFFVGGTIKYYVSDKLLKK